MQIPPINPNDKSSDTNKISREYTENNDESVFGEKQTSSENNIETNIPEDNVLSSNKKDGGIWAEIMEALKGFFDKNKSETQIETEKILKEKGIVETENTKEIKNVNVDLEAKKQEYLVSHPEPVFNEADNPGISAVEQEAMRVQWQNGLNRFVSEETNKTGTKNTEIKSAETQKTDKEE